MPANFLESKEQDYRESVEAIREGYEDMNAGRTRPLRNSRKSCAQSMAFHVEITTQADARALSPCAGECGLSFLKWFYEHKPHTYRVIFTVAGDGVYVLRIRHGCRKHLAMH